MNAIPVDFHFIQWVDFHHEIRPWSLQSRPAVRGASQATALVESPLKNGLVIVELCSVATDKMADVTVRKSSRYEIANVRKKPPV